jgi:hypothetical protein
MFRSTCAGVMITAFVVTFFFMSFKDAPGSNDIKERIASPGVSPGVLPGVAEFRGYMDTLYVDIPTFLARAPRKKRLVFKYYITAEDSLTLCGWRTVKDRANNHRYDPKDELILINGGADLTIPIGPGSFLGGVVLTKADIGTIRDYIGTHKSMRFVIFVPQKDSTYAGHVYYDIFLIDYDPKLNGEIHTLSAPVKVIGVGANPSPPRKS